MTEAKKPQKEMSLRRQKLRWCVEHHSALAHFPGGHVQYLLNQMPHLMQKSGDDRKAAEDKLNQYFTSTKVGYWQTRKTYIEELCAALQLPLAIWNCEDLEEFKLAATNEYTKKGILANPYRTPAVYKTLNHLRQLPVTNGSSVITFDVERDQGMPFRRRARYAISAKFNGDDRIRIRFAPLESGFGLLFLLGGSADSCKILAPTVHQTQTLIQPEGLFVPQLHEPKFYPPEEIGRYKLYATVTPQPLSGDIARTNDDEGLGKEQVSQLVEICESALAMGNKLYRVDFLVTEGVQYTVEPETTSATGKKPERTAKTDK